ncbi:hypothetical protein GCM10009862_15980 [Microbacterium binotii]|uniref:Uncharacterized protein n=2 Tax=Microbacterium binotii TaxID=462710 RepID=A0ABN3PBG6_9MICO
MSWMSEIDASMRETGDIYAYEAARAAGDEREAERIMAHHRAIVAAGLLPVPAASASAGVMPLRYSRGVRTAVLIVAADLAAAIGLGVAVAGGIVAGESTALGGVVTYWDGQP